MSTLHSNGKINPSLDGRLQENVETVFPNATVHLTGGPGTSECKSALIWDFCHV